MDGVGFDAACEGVPDDVEPGPPPATKTQETRPGNPALVVTTEIGEALTVNQTQSQGTQHVGPEQVREALFAKRRPLVKPLFAPNRPAGVPIVSFEPAEPEHVSFFRRIADFFRA